MLMRILHITTRFAFGGSERDLLRQIAWERARGFEVDLAVGGDEPIPSLPEGLQPYRIDALIPRISPGHDARALWQLRALLRRRPYEVVHTHQSKAGVLGRIAARSAACAIVHTVHMASFGPGYSRHASSLQAAAERYCGRFTDLIVCVGNELRSSYIGAGIAGPERYVLMRTPVDIDAFARVRRLNATERAHLRTSLGLDGNPPLVLAIGALEPRKRHAMLIERLAGVLRSGIATLALAGDGPERAALEQQVRSRGLQDAVRFLGQTSQVVELLGCADALALSSRAEGVPRVVIEALAAGVPIVATDVEGLREVPGAPITIVRRDGEGLAEAVKDRVRSRRPAPVPLEALAEWRPAAVDEQIASIYERLGAQVAIGA